MLQADEEVDRAAALDAHGPLALQVAGRPRAERPLPGWEAGEVAAGRPIRPLRDVLVGCNAASRVREPAPTLDGHVALVEEAHPDEGAGRERAQVDPIPDAGGTSRLQGVP